MAGIFPVLTRKSMATYPLTSLGKYAILVGMESFREIVETWGRQQMATDLGVPKERARQWSRDNSIPQWYWKGLLAKAPDRNILVSPELLIDLAARD